MEENPTLRQQIPHPSTEGAIHASRLQRTIRTLLTPILLAGAVAALDIPSSVDAKDPVKEAQKAEDPTIAALRLDVTRLIADLDSDRFPVREKASKKLRELAVDWVKRTMEPFPFESLITATKGHSLEQSRRLERVYESYDNEKVKLLWLPTKFREPAEWKNRKVPLKISDILQELSRQTGQRFLLYTTEEWQGSHMEDSPVRPSSFDGRTFWGVLEELQKGIDQQVDIRRFGDDSLNVTSCWQGCRSLMMSQGSVGAQFQIDPRARRAWLTIEAEPKLRIGQVRLVEAVGKTNTGERFEPYEPVRGRGIGRALGLAIPHVPRAKTADVTFTVEVEAYRPKTVPIIDLKKAQRIKSNVCAFEYQRTEGTTERTSDQKNVWQIHGTSKVGWQGVDLFHLVRCKAFDAKNQPIRWYGDASQQGLGPLDEYTWEFWEEPHHIEFSVPERSTRRTLTFAFSGVPMP